VLVQWEARVRQAEGLLKRFEHEMSPRLLFAEPPLSNCSSDTQRWLSDLVDLLWRVRYPVNRWIHDGKQALGAAMACYARLRQALDEPATRSAAPTFWPRKDFEDFRAACLRLAEAIERLPHGILVV